MKGIKKYFFITISLILCTFLLYGCTDFNDTFNKIKDDSDTLNIDEYQIIEVTADTEKTNELNLKDSTILLSSKAINYGEYNISIVGANLDKSNGDINEDGLTAGAGLLNESTDESIARGFNLGFYISSDPEIKKKNAYLSVYLKFEMNDENATQRDSVIPNITISGEDNQEDKLNLIYYSNKKKYIDLEYPYGVIILKTYYDSETYIVQIKDTKFTIDTKLLKQ